MFPAVPHEIQAEMEAGALVVVNHSGGKDSQALLIRTLEVVPPWQVLVVHATLGESEWPGALEHARNQAQAAGAPFLVAQAEKTFLELVEHRFRTRPDVPSWPGPRTRFCTSTLKQAAITKGVRRYAKERGIKRIINTMGMRAEESSPRAKKPACSPNREHGVAGRSWWDWLAIHSLKREEVFATVAQAGQQLHPAYEIGNERLSCVFCFMACRSDLRNGAEHNPALYAKYVDMEHRTGYTLHVSRKSLPELTGITP